MITKEQFITLIANTDFFKNVGNASPGNSVIVLSSLAPWGNETNASESDIRIADQMDWLPTTREQSDPFYPYGLDSEATSEDVLIAIKSYRIEVYKAILGRLRMADFSRLKAGPNNFAEAAKGAAAYSFRNAATEVVLGIQGRWLEVAEVYFNGNWPCGLTKTGKLVVI